MGKNQSSFIIENYGQKSTFASFLPGIAGVRGVPIWSFYVNRGQGIASFGVDNKENSIMEYSPAHRAYQDVKTTGFRTFIKKDGKVYEPFSDEEVTSRMKISMNLLELEEENEESGLHVKVCYYVLPNERLGGLVRTVTVANVSKQDANMEILDGMPALIPCGVNLARIKEITQTAKAWMQVEDVEKKIPYFRTRASLDDSAEVSMIEAGNYALGFQEDGSLLPMIVDPTFVFQYDTAMRKAVHFEKASLKELFKQEQVTANEFPCCFFGKEAQLPADTSITFYEIFGQATSKDSLHAYLEETRNAEYFSKKKAEAEKLTEELTDKVKTSTASKEFDEYCRYNFMDNLLRGGYPVKLGKDKIFYVYSRKHGDLERDYNFFAMSPECYSQGNGNFRDVNQNRRCDTFFEPFVEKKNIQKFYSLIQLDGYNPLLIEKLTYCLSEDTAKKLFGNRNQQITEYVTKPFTPGGLYMKLEKCFGLEEADGLFDQIIDAADTVINEEFGEGYWVDHWTYNLDLIEDYLEVYPDKEKELFFEEELTCFLSRININDRKKRYVETKNGLRQYLSLNEDSRRDTSEKLVRTRRQQGEVLKMSLLEKLIMMCAVKFAALDAYGMGIEMEGGKPGWYDALNGLPGMFGSSMNEAYEVCRMLDYVIGILRKYDETTLSVLEEVAVLLEGLDLVNQEEYEAIHSCDSADTPEQIRTNGQILDFWNKVNDLKEEYRDKVFEGVFGEKRQMDAETLRSILTGFADTVRSGIHKAKVLAKDSIPAYFSYEVPEYEVSEDGIEPKKFEPVKTPHFLEGAVRYLKLNGALEHKREVYKSVKESDLYDEKLKMYKVNASLSSASYELGRAVAFMSGWLENESIWLHMEYKYLLELIRSGLYREFYEDFRNAVIPFLDPEVYGRSIYENSSFLVSSQYPNKALHGKGYVARLSGSTIEFISMWKQMMFGAHVLDMKDNELIFAPQPAIPQYLIPDSGCVSAMLFGSAEVTYYFAECKDYVPGEYEIQSMKFIHQDGHVSECSGWYAAGQIPKELRQGKIQSVVIEIK